MRITIVRFRSYVESASFTFPSLGLALIAGPSGSGKSTLFEALQWVLFGGMSHIYPTGSPGTTTKQTAVLLELPEAGGVCIRRTKPPETIEYCIPDGKGAYTITTGPSAQAQIEALFGSRDLWIASSYISQGARSPLVTASVKERFDLLKQLTFDQADGQRENPDFYVATIDAKTYEVKRHLTAEQGAYHALLKQFEDLTKTHATTVQTWTDAKHPTSSTTEVATAVASLTTKHTTLTAEIATLSTAHTAARDAEVRYAEAQRTLTKTQEHRKVLHAKQCDVKPLEAERAKLKTMLASADLAASLRQEITTLTARRAKLRVDPNHLTLTPTEAVALRALAITNRDQHLGLEALGVTSIERDATLANLDLAIRAAEKARATYSEWERTCEDLRHQRAEVTAKYEAEYTTRIERHRLQLQARDQIIAANDLVKQKAALEKAEYVRLTLAHQRYDAAVKRDSEGQRYRVELHELNLKLGDVGKVREHVRGLQLLLLELTCPHCAQGLQLVDGQLKKGSGASRATAKTDLEALEGLLTHHRVLELRVAATSVPPNELIKPDPLPPLTEPVYQPVPPAIPPSPYRSSLKLPDLPPEPTRAPDVGLLRQRREALIALPVPGMEREKVAVIIASLDDLDTYTALTRQITDCQTRLPIEAGDDVAARTRLVELEAILVEQHQLGGQLTLLETQIAALLATPAPTISATDLATKLAETETQASGVQAMINAGQVLHTLLLHRSVLEQKHASILQYAQFEADLARLKTVITEVASQAMEEVVASINVNANMMLASLFEDDIRILLATSRTLKTKDKTKLEVNLQIHYKGQTYANPSQLSGGEQDRVSLAITLALAKLNTAPFLLLDECMASLDGGLRDRCLKTIRHHLANKTILHVCHEVVEGYHDEVVRLVPIETK